MSTRSGATRRSTRIKNEESQIAMPAKSTARGQAKASKIKEEPATPEKLSGKTSSRKRAAQNTENETSTGRKKIKKEIKEEPDQKTGLPSPSESEKENQDDEFVESEAEDEEDDDYSNKTPSSTKKKAQNSSPKSKSRSKSKPKSEDSDKKTVALQSKKLKTFNQYNNKSPFPDFLHPTPEECKLAHKILASLHGERKRPKEVVARNDRAGCGDSPSVLDALVRTILSQNTSDTNSTRAKKSMDKVYGGSDKWDAIVEGGEAKLEESIRSGGLSKTKSHVITSILNQTMDKYGKYSLDHLQEASNEDAMTELISFQGVGPKTASCVLLFCLQRESFAVDTHVWRITGLLGWRPKSASRDETHAHLDVRVPDEDKYGLHILLVNHGKKCDECRAGGKNLGKCELRKAFRKGKLEGQAGDEVKEEEEDIVKEEED